jgi:hypothetical protein
MKPVVPLGAMKLGHETGYETGNETGYETSERAHGGGEVEPEVVHRKALCRI